MNVCVVVLYVPWHARGSLKMFRNQSLLSCFEAASLLFLPCSGGFGELTHKLLGGLPVCAPASGSHAHSSKQLCGGVS